MKATRRRRRQREGGGEGRGCSGTRVVARAALIACNERSDDADDAASLSRGSRTCQLLICCCLFVHDSNVFTSLGDVKVPQMWSWEMADSPR